MVIKKRERIRFNLTFYVTTKVSNVVDINVQVAGTKIYTKKNVYNLKFTIYNKHGNFIQIRTYPKTFEQQRTFFVFSHP